MLHKEIKYSYNDISLRPAVLTDIKHREECNVYLPDKKLPIFTAPMSSVIRYWNYKCFDEAGIIPILPRSEYIVRRRQWLMEGKWVALSLKEFKNYFLSTEERLDKQGKYRVLIDIANGHMRDLYESIKTVKKNYGGNLTIMAGNVANPETYRTCWEAGVDYVRLSIGTGFGCISSTQLGVHYPIVSLLDETYKIKKYISEARGIPFDTMPKIIADGGIRGYSDVIKALAVGADYVMIGGEFAKLVESAAPLNVLNPSGVVNNKFLNENRSMLRHVGDHFVLTLTTPVRVDGLYKTFYGMASKQGQIDINGRKTKTSEGNVKQVEVTTNLDKWVENMAAYMRSAMSYLNLHDITELNPENVDVFVISENTRNSINK